MGKKPKNLSEALDQLEGSSSNLIREKLADLQGLLDELAPQLGEYKEQIEEKVGHAVERAKKAGHEIDEAVHEQPWIAVGVVGLFALILGYLLGRRR